MLADLLDTMAHVGGLIAFVGACGACFYVGRCLMRADAPVDLFDDRQPTLDADGREIRQRLEANR